MRFVSEIGVKKWGILAKTIKNTLKLPMRTGKQCRERWYNHLSPDINKSTWSESEIRMVFDLQEVYGNHWSQISHHLQGRTDNAVKNLYYSSIRKTLRKSAKAKGLKKVKKLENKKVQTVRKAEKPRHELEIVNDDEDMTEVLLSLSKAKAGTKEKAKESVSGIFFKQPQASYQDHFVFPNYFEAIWPAQTWDLIHAITNSLMSSNY